MAFNTSMIDPVSMSLPPGLTRSERNQPKVETHLFDTRHFALETHGQEIANRIQGLFLGRR